ncbi:MAG: cupin domain-containing protein [Alphaproteobacteria bacterium]|nr:cupin domain-containing protein [Alphaproteobacteria bacterium]
MRVMAMGLGAALLMGVLSGSSLAAGAGAGGEGFVRVRPEALHWVDVPDSPGVMSATVLGDPDKPGVYIIRYRFPPHVMDTPHRHPRDRFVTVLSGTWCTGTGETFDAAKAEPLPVGSVMKHPAGAAHWDGSCGAEPVVVQIMGEGPAGTTPVDPKAPDWVRVGP